MVTGGTFYRGYDLATDGRYTDMSRPATISSFRLDRYEVTIGRFRQFVMSGRGTQNDPPAAGAGAHGIIANSGWQTAWNTSLPTDTAALVASLQSSSTWTDSPGANENRPVDSITWFEAMAFCAWDVGYLPTEAEWHYAASGGTEQRAYPWSTSPGDITIDCNHANYNIGTMSCVPGLDVVGARSPVGDGLWGQADLAGNAMEWVLDWYAAYVNPCNDCASLAPTSGRIGRGGAPFDDATILRAASRYHMGSPSIPSFGVGTRCARPL
jgi:formylglycine-generating enzyme required for sulfatase activity